MVQVRKEYRFNNSSDEIDSLQRDIVDFIAGYFPGDRHVNGISNIRQALIELLTNAVKHSGTDHSIIEVHIHDRIVRLCKLDTGAPFEHSAIRGWPLSPDLTGQEVTLYRDDLFRVGARVESEYHLTFHVEEYPIGMLDAHSNLCEHYGFLILVKASSRFSYRYVPQTGLNHFCVIIEV